MARSPMKVMRNLLPGRKILGPTDHNVPQPGPDDTQNAPAGTPGRGRALVKHAHRQLMALSKDAGKVPKEWKKDAQYRIRLTRAVEVRHGHMMRPNMDVVVSGEYAASLDPDLISGATEL